MNNQFIRNLVVSFFFCHCFWLGSQAQTKSQLKSDQEELNQQLFPGAKLPLNYRFRFPYLFKEHTIPTQDKISLSSLLFRVKAPKGVILYLHGSNNALDVWGNLALTYTRLQYDVWMIDYRGYGKSGGKITGEEQLHRDMQTVYDYVKRLYPENQIVLLGH